MLFAAGSEDDCREASRVAADLRSDHPDFPYFNQTEEYCSVDPCDPTSECPENLNDTAKKYEAIEVDNLLTHMGASKEEWMWKDALISISRFAEDVAIQKNRELLSTILTRTGMPLRQLALNGTNLIPLMTTGIAQKLLARVETDDFISEVPDRDQKIVAMFVLYFAFLQLSGNEQLEAMTSPMFRGDYSLDLVMSMKAPDKDILVERLKKALAEDDLESVFGALSLASYTFKDLTPNLVAEIDKCRSSESSLVRAAVFEIALKTETDSLISGHAEGNWSYVDAKDTNTYEAWYGSILLIRAAVKQQISLEKLMARISPSTWYYAAEKIGSPISKLVLCAIDDRLLTSMEAAKVIDIPLIDLKLANHDLRPQYWISLSELEQKQAQTSRSVLATSSEGDFYKKQDRMNVALEELQHELADKDAKLLIDRIDLDVLGKLLRERPEFLERWSALLSAATAAQMHWLQNLALSVASALETSKPSEAVALFRKAYNANSFVTISYGDDLSLEHKAIWSCSMSSEIKVLWIERILNAHDDADLAREVLAAERFGASSFIRSYVDELLETGLQIDCSYAITIAGFSNQFTEMGAIIEQFIGGDSFVSDTAKAAMKALERAQWSQYWLEKMWSAEMPENYWANMQICMKILDARTVYTSDIYRDEHRWHAYAPIFVKERKKRIKKWHTKREKTLLGIEKPDPIFCLILPRLN